MIKAEWTNKDVLTQSETTGQSKSILVIDTPNDCYDCPCYYEERNKCEVIFKNVDDDIEKPSWCPLRPLPREWTMDEVDPCAYNEGFVDGVNYCIYSITGDTE